MSAKEELIAAALTAADELDKLSIPMHSRMSPHAAALREACARAMVQPDMAEVERLIRRFSLVADEVSRNLIDISYLEEARAALLDYVRGVIAERDALVADNERLMQIAAQEVSPAPQPVGAAEVPMPEENILKIRALDSAEVRWIDREALRTYGEQCRAAGYAAGLAAGGKDAERLPMSYGGCNCACHRTPGVRHYVACCKPLGDAK